MKEIRQRYNSAVQQLIEIEKAFKELGIEGDTFHRAKSKLKSRIGAIQSEEWVTIPKSVKSELLDFFLKTK